MAYVQGKTGTIETTKGNFKIKLSWSETYDTSLNSSIISVRLYLFSSTYGGTWFPSGGISVDGSTVVSMNFNSPATHQTGGSIYNTWQEVVNQSTYGVAPPWTSAAILHNTDGSKEVTISINNLSVYNSQNGTIALGSLSQTVSLTTIQRSSGVSAGNIVLGNSCSVIWTPESSLFYYKIKFTLGSWNDTTSIIHPNQTSAYTYTGYIIPLSVANQFASSSSKTMSATLYTFSDSGAKTQIGSATTTFTVSIPGSMVPTISSLSVTIDNGGSTILDEWGIAVSGVTSAKIEASGTGIYGSTISSYTITGGYSVVKSGASLLYEGSAISETGDVSFSVTCKDSRGKVSSASVSDPITFYEYSNPSVKTFDITRNGSSVDVLATWSITSFDNRNTSTAELYYKKAGTSGWVKYGNVENGILLTTTSNFSEENSYNWRIVVTDALGKTGKAEVLVSTASVLLDFKAGGTGFGVGKICENDNFMEVGLNAKFYNDVYINDRVLPKYIQDIREWKLIWINASPTSSFGSQTLMDDVTDYDMIIIVFRYSTTHSFEQCVLSRDFFDCVGFYPAGTNDGVSIQECHRYITVHSTGEIYANDGYLGSQVDNSYCIPWMIYGQKKV